ncbi:uncharacterized protein LOC131673036 [Phymastichus coffea]|uniref:uncharacterized protein LOC131673036 n=1 Tax=Phymastichus coffea TaxID=108790 RepID=UPI00273B3DED|nr:uncharacterized protein LOC131673036 [Phymastichus coffea]XP_058806662.1 uncharacterized protein LOC131673036 [Phymastichus coffea]XP_058806663.1 uncharacterized protein LOC131673036 [Phymastichus coffea]
MQLQSVTSSRDVLRADDETANHLSTKEERRSTGRYIAGGAAIAIILLALHHVFVRGASSIAGICIPAIIMAIYIIWVLYTARRDQRRALRLASAMHLVKANDSSDICNIDDATVGVIDQSKNNPTDPSNSIV